MALSAGVLTRQQVREVDRIAVDHYGIPGMVLMENAGRGCADVIENLGVHGPVCICCGKGNNAGDGFVIARHLDRRGHDVTVLVWGDETDLQGDALVNFRILGRAGIPVISAQKESAEAISQHVQAADWVVDALLGTGATGAPRPPLDQAIRLMNQAPGKRLAVDLPSGLDCDTGQVCSVAVMASHTCTFVAPKPGLLNNTTGHVGQIHVVDIGVPRRLLQQFQIDDGQ